MYLPDNMTFQYFFFDTYYGYFLQALPIALLAGIVYVIIKRKRRPQLSLGRTLLSALFVCYLAGLLCLTLFYYVLGDAYYWLFYHMPSGGGSYWFSFEYNFMPDFWNNLTSERLGNILLFLPFGILYPLFDRKATWTRTLLIGVVTSLVIELLQPIFGRSFDINDIILNSMGVVMSTSIFFILHSVISNTRK